MTLQNWLTVIVPVLLFVFGSWLDLIRRIALLEGKVDIILTQHNTKKERTKKWIKKLSPQFK